MQRVRRSYCAAMIGRFAWWIVFCAPLSTSAQGPPVHDFGITRLPPVEPSPVRQAAFTPHRETGVPLGHQQPPTVQPWQEQLPSPAPQPHDGDEAWLNSWRAPPDSYFIDILARSYFINDQRIEWSGQEATFGVEGVLYGQVERQAGEWDFGLVGELYLNQPFDRNILVDTAERRSYLGNWDIPTLEISELYLTARKGNWLWAAGKMMTPFGRTYFPLYTNARSDAPFIRTESILWRESGVLLQYDPEYFTANVALMNGGDDRDANSSKALISRIGYDTPNFAAGASIKFQDGIGSEGQKTYNEHVGIDLMFRRGNWIVSAEAIYDKYGFRRPGFSPNDITWRKSIYYRDQNFAYHQPITGFGYYVNFGWQSPHWTAMLNYGEFYPRDIGVPQHDVTTRRGIVKLIHHSPWRLDVYAMVVLENDVPNAQDGRRRKGFAVLTGAQFAF